MKIEELVESLRPKPPVKEGEVLPNDEPITDTGRLIGPAPRGMSICFPRTSNALRDSLTQDLIAGIERRQNAVKRSAGTILVYDPVSHGMQRRAIHHDGHLGGVEL